MRRRPQTIVTTVGTLLAASAIAAPSAMAADPSQYCGNSTLTQIFDGTGTAEPMASSGLLGLSDPELFKSAYNEWVMLAAGLDEGSPNSGIDIYASWLGASEPLSSAATDWTIGNTPLVARPSSGAWDDFGIETPSFVWTGSESRIYYTGSDDAYDHQDDPGANFAIGYMRWNGSAWERHGDPVIEAYHSWESWNGYDFVLEPAIRKYGSSYYMQYGAGDPSGASADHGGMATATSTDGVSWPTANRELTWDAYDVKIVAGFSFWTSNHENVNSRYETVFGTLGNALVSWAGIWWAESDTASQDPSDFTTFTHLAQTSASTGLDWHDDKMFAPTFKYEDNKIWVFFRAVDGDNGPGRPHIGRFYCSTA